MAQDDFLKFVRSVLFGTRPEVNVPPGASREQVLEVTLEARRRDLSRNILFRKKSLVGAALLVLGSSIIVVFYPDQKELLGMTLLYAGGFALTGWVRDIGGIKREIQEKENELDYLKIPVESQEQRASKAFKLHQIELQRYYDQTLVQSKWIFWAGIVSLLLGFFVIGWTLFYFTAFQDFFSGTNAQQIDLQDKIIVGVLGAVGGVMTNFIAAVYMKMFSEIIQSLTKFHGSLVATHHLHFANILLSKIQDAQLREKTLADLASSLKGGPAA